MKWLKEQEDFNRRKREHDLQLVEIEKQEILRREQKVKRKKEDLDVKRQKHLMLQDDLTTQVLNRNIKFSMKLTNDFMFQDLNFISNPQSLYD